MYMPSRLTVNTLRRLDTRYLLTWTNQQISNENFGLQFSQLNSTN